MVKRERRYDIDWLRVIAFYILIFFHAGMMFVPWDFHIKNPETSATFEPLMILLHQWRLPLLFVISGIGVKFALGHRTPLQFVSERFRRLFIPLLFGMLVIVPPQVFFERISNGIEFAGYFDFYNTVFDFVPYPEGNFSWHHLWFIIYLFVYCLLCLPLFLYLRKESGKKLLEKVAVFLGKPGMIFTFAIPLTLVFNLLALDWPESHNLVADWYYLSYCMLFFIYGYIICSNKRFWNILENQRYISLCITISLTVFLYTFSWTPVVELFSEENFTFYIYGLLKSINILGWIFTILGFSRKHLNKPSKLLSYANESVYPFYILHQTITIALGYYIIKWDLGILPKFLLVAFVTLAGSLIIYELFIKRINFTRFLFGMKPKAKRTLIKIKQKEIQTEPVDYLTQGSD